MACVSRSSTACIRMYSLEIRVNGDALNVTVQNLPAIFPTLHSSSIGEIGSRWVCRLDRDDLCIAFRLEFFSVVCAIPVERGSERASDCDARKDKTLSHHGIGGDSLEAEREVGACFQTLWGIRLGCLHSGVLWSCHTFILMGFVVNNS